MEKVKTIKAWAVLIPNLNLNRDDVFMNDGIKGRFWARITRTKKQAEQYYPEYKIGRVEIKFLN